MTLTRVRLQRFTAFENLDLELSPGINVLVGANGTGKTHLDEGLLRRLRGLKERGVVRGQADARLPSIRAG